MNKVSILFSVVFLLFAHHSEASCDCSSDSESKEESKRPNLLKGIAVGSILGAGAGGVLLPILGRSIPFLNPEKDGFFAVKYFAAGVILATAFVHILPDAFEMLGSACLPSRPWQEFPFAGFVSMLSALGTMLIESMISCYYKKSHFAKPHPIDEERIQAEDDNAHQGHVHAHTHASHGHAHGTAAGGGLPLPDASATQRIRHRVISQVLEVGIVAHSVIIGISVGTSQNAKTIKPLVVALSFHQFFEGVGLGGCIVQADFKARATAIKTIFYSLTTPLGIMLGIAISSSYDPNSTKALIIEGIFNAVSAGILIYISLVDLLAADLTDFRMQNSIKLQVGAHATLLLGSGFMLLLAKWA